MGTFVAYKGERESYLGCCVSYMDDGLSLEIENVPIIRIKDKLLIGIINSQLFHQYLLVDALNFPQYTFQSILESLRTIPEEKEFENIELLIVTIDGNLLHWKGGVLYHVKNNWIAIGDGKDYIMGALFGMKSMSIPDKSKLEIALDSVREYSKYTSKTIKIESIG